MKTWKIHLISLTQNKICLNVSKSVVVLFKSKTKNKKKQQTNKKTIVSDLKHYNQEDYTEDYTNQWSTSK